MENGRLPDSVLALIPNGRLQKEPAAAWNAMRADIGKRTNVWISPSGPVSSYRTFAQQQVFWDLYRAGKGNLAAVPGTSNHGWGLAVDVATPQMASLINRYGAKYGYQKSWSDAQSEWWHFKYRSGVWKGKIPSGIPLLKYKSTGPSVIKLKKLLAAKGIKNFSTSVNGQPNSNRYNPFFGKNTRAAVERFQKANDLPADGIVGASTWNKLS